MNSHFRHQPDSQFRPANMPMTTRAVDDMPRRRWTVAEIEEMVRVGVIDEDERFELIEGDVVPMSPKAPSMRATRLR
jgi:hypothetical protein